jgi:hypothetical protein
MSTPPPAGPHDGERRKSLGKYVKRMSSVFKREKSSKSVTQASSAAAAPPASHEEQTQQPEVDVPTKEEQVEVVGGDVVPEEGAPEPAKAESIRQEHPTGEPAAMYVDLQPYISSYSTNCVTVQLLPSSLPPPASNLPHPSPQLQFSTAMPCSRSVPVPFLPNMD